MQNKKVIVVTYYWPPSGGSGVQRWLKFVKYLPQFGWTPYVLTPENPSFMVRDDSLLHDVPAEAIVVKLPIWEPYRLFFGLSRLAGKKDIKSSDFISTGKRSVFQAFSSWVRGNFFIPDARVYWVKPAVAFLEKYLRELEIGTLITTGPPHSIHLIGLQLKKKNPALNWVADFRDPWSAWDLLDTLSLTSRSRQKHVRLEREVLTTANHVITISPYHVQRFETLGGRTVTLISNGFDETDFQGITREKTSRFTISHVGVVDELRDPRPVMEALQELCLEDLNFANSVSLKFIGHVNSAFKEFITASKALNTVTTFVDHLPHQQLLRLYGQTDLQLLVLAHTVIAPGNLPGKFFEYLASGNPVLAVGPVGGDAGAVLRQTKAGEIFERSDKAGIKASLLMYFHQWKTGGAPARKSITNFTRKNLTKQLVNLLES